MFDIDYFKKHNSTSQSTGIEASREVAACFVSSYVSVGVFLAGVISARFGLWIADLVSQFVSLDVEAAHNVNIANCLIVSDAIPTYPLGRWSSYLYIIYAARSRLLLGNDCSVLRCFLFATSDFTFKMFYPWSSLDKEA